ncbi:MAG: hypothetical protein KDD69_03610 [Bdellovibrionales bacterium]|nr:hypothetical protein [Bdellovibrionales bacterium]
MSTFFVPYTRNVPAAIEIKGHKLLIVASEPEDIAADLQLIGADEIREIDLPGDEAQTTEVLADLAAEVGGGVVLTPAGVSPSVMIHSLEQELPWIH